MRNRILILLLVAASVAGAARAERRWYAGVKVGQASFDSAVFDEVTQAGALFGWHLYRGPGGNLAVEGEFTTTISQGDLNIDISLQPVPEWELDTIGVYAAYRSGGLFYVKARAGFVDGSAEVRSTGQVIPLQLEASDTVTSGGLGVGWRFLKLFAVELEWTRSFFDQELDVYSVGVNF